MTEQEREATFGTVVDVLAERRRQDRAGDPRLTARETATANRSAAAAAAAARRRAEQQQADAT